MLHFSLKERIWIITLIDSVMHLCWFTMRSNILCALFPATWHQEEKEVRSHGGLTYGGLLLNKSVGVLESCDILLEIVKFYRDNFQAQRMLVNPVPSLYHETAAEDQLFALHYIEAQLFRRYISTSVALDRKIELSTNRKRQIKKGFYNMVSLSNRTRTISFHSGISLQIHY